MSTTPPGRRTGASSRYSKADLDEYALDFQLVFANDWFMVAEIETETVAMAITIPDINQVLKKMDGRLLPLGWWYYLRQGQDHRPAAGRLPWSQARVPAHRRRARRCTWITSTSPPGPAETRRSELHPGDQHVMNRGLEAMGGKIVKRYRVYERPLSSGGA